MRSQPLRVGSLFAGIGGFDLAAHWMGWRTVWVSEIDPYASQILAKHFPSVPNLGDIRAISQPPAIDVLCGGFPCQDISVAGRGTGITGSRSGLWKEYARVIGETRPSWVVIENSPALRHRGLGVVLDDLRALGYDAEWHCIPAAAVGAPHQRDRVWIVAYPCGEQEYPVLGGGWPEGGATAPPAGPVDPLESGGGTGGAWAPDVADAEHQRLLRRRLAGDARPKGEGLGGVSRDELSGGDREAAASVADSLGARLEGHAGDGTGVGERGWLAPQPDGPAGTAGLRHRADTSGWWEVEPNVGRVAHGVPNRVDRLRCLGNAVVPQVPFFIFQCIQRRIDEQRQTHP